MKGNTAVIPRESRQSPTTLHKSKESFNGTK